MLIYILESITNIVSNIDDVMYTYIIVVLLLLCGIICTFRTKFVQIRKLKDMFKYMIEKDVSNGKNSISSFQALMISTGSRVGTGNIAGIATAIILGGPGAIFWMWILAIIGASSAFVESTLAQIFKKKGKDGSFIGGPAYYIEKGLGKRWLGILFSIMLILTFAFGFNSLQAFNSASSLDYYLPIFNLDANLTHCLLGFILVAITSFAIFGGMKVIGKISTFLVPIMALIYVALALFTVFSNIQYLGKIFELIFNNALGYRAILSGSAGIALIYGTKRGLLSNEAGMGSAPNAAATATVSHPVKQGLTQSLSAYIDTFFICTSSAFMVMVYCVSNPSEALNFNGMPLVQQALSSSIGEVGIHFMTISIFFFAFSSIIGNYVYAENNFKFITSNKNALQIFRLFCLLPVYFGCLSNIDLAWGCADIFMGIMATINIVAVLMLSKWSIAALKDYESQKKKGLNPVFKSSNIPNFPKTDCWN